MCSANQVDAKRQKYFTTASNRTQDDIAATTKKRRETNLKRYGSGDIGRYGSNSFKQTMIDKYGDANYNNKGKIANTCLERYGVKSHLLTDDAKNRKSEIYGDANFNNREKYKETCMNRYGADSVAQYSNVIEKMITTKRDKIASFSYDNSCTHVKRLKTIYGQGRLKLSPPKILGDNGRGLYLCRPHSRNLDGCLSK